MDNWHPLIVHRMALDRHREDIARGEADQRLATVPGSRPGRAHLARALSALATRLDPACHATRQEMANITPSVPA